jgi:hypothetical protein
MRETLKIKLLFATVLWKIVTAIHFVYIITTTQILLEHNAQATNKYQLETII